MGPEPLEGLPGRDPETFGQHPFGLLDAHPAFEGALQLLGAQLGILHDASAEDADRCHVRDRLAEMDIRLSPQPWLLREDVQRPDGVVSKPEGERVR